ncbi:MAG: Na/Pi cotransporter family protein [Clostridia bacterium]|nr:Na/Pi cotransporter family protein [Clostridia bacterium]
MEIVYNILLFLAGLGIFIKAMDMLSKNMQSLFGFKLREKMQKLSNKYFVGSLMGMGGTVALQSSTAIIVLLISFVQIGVLSLSQSLPIVIGVNVGASLIFTSLLASAFNLTIIFASITVVGAFITLLGRSTKVKTVGNVLFAFGLLFLGLYLISVSMSFLKELDIVNNLFLTITNPILLILIGTCMSLLTQSSLATNAIIISLCATAGSDVGLAISSALWLSIGSRIGPTSAGILASIGKYKVTKLVALFHLLFNVCTMLLFALSTLTGWTMWLEEVLVNPALIIVVFNFICSFATAIILLPLVKPIGKLLPKIFKFKKNKDDIFEIDENLFKYPDLCIGQFSKQFEVLFENHTKNLKSLFNYCLDADSKVTLKHIENENLSFYNNIDKVKSNLSKLHLGLSDKQKIKMYFYLDVVGRYHSLADRTNKIISLFPNKPTYEFKAEQIELAKALCDELLKLNSVCEKVLLQLGDEDENKRVLISQAFEIDSEITKHKLALKESIIKSYQEDKATASFTDKYSRLINQLEQMGEHYSAICFFAYDSEVEMSRQD